MAHHIRKAFVCGLIGVATCVGSAAAQAPPPEPEIANPRYVTIPLEVTVNRPAAEVWKRVGRYCGIEEWLPIKLPPCKITSGKETEIGAVRSVGAEVMVGMSELSYTYTQTVKKGQPYNLYHGTLEAKALTPTTSKLIYTLFFDNSMLPTDAAREQDKKRRADLFQTALENMKTLAEGGTVTRK